MTQKLQTNTFDSAVKDGVALVDFYADWCPPCKALAPTIDKLAEKHSESSTIAKVNVDESPELAKRFGVRSIPTVVALKDAEEVGRVTGNVPLGQLEQLLEGASQ